MSVPAETCEMSLLVVVDLREEVGRWSYRVRGNVGAQLSEGESESDDEDAETLARAAIVDESVEDLERVPDLLLIDRGCRR